MELKFNVNTDKSYDVVVVGSGPAGMGAAIEAGRQGVKTLIIESCGRLGGISTAGMMSHFTGSVGNKLYWEVLLRAWKKTGYPGETVQEIDPDAIVRIDPELLTVTYIEMLEEAGVDILLYTTVFDVIKEGDKVKGIICLNKSGIQAITAKVVIDASGDGDVAYKAGAEYILGREGDNKMQPATLMFKVAGVDMERAVFPPSFETQIETPKGELQSLARKLLPHPAGHVLLYESTIPGVVTVNMTNVTDIDGTKAEDLTRAEIVTRKQLVPIVKFLREYVPGYENCYVIGSASLIGVRETRHFKGVKQVVKEDIENAVQHEDFVVYDAYFNFDVHNITGSGLDETGCQKHFTQRKGYTIPYGALVPEKIDGLLLSGRNISGTHMAHSSYRAMPICLGIGEAGGAAAAIAVKSGREVREITAEEIRKVIM